MLALLAVSRLAGCNTTTPWTGSCTDDSDCNYNGVCASSSCRCDPAWLGPACDRLNLQPAQKSEPLGYRGVNSSSGYPITSWGGSVIHGDDGLWHMYAAEIAGSCGMNVWLSNSRVIHATSPDPATTPFTRTSVVADVFAHEPIAVRAPTGEYVVWYTAVLPPGRLPVQGGRFCTGCTTGNSLAECGTDAARNASISLPTYMVYSDSPHGPWSTPQMVPGTDVFADSNFAPVINADGSLVALARRNVYAASDWRNLSSYHVVGTWDDEGEDPFVWADERGVYHNIVHVRRENTVGRHYYSVDGKCWVASEGDAYTNRVAFTDGSELAYGCRERPHIVRDKHGTIVGLTNGAAEKTCHSDEPPVVDYSYTLLQRVGN